MTMGTGTKQNKNTSLNFSVLSVVVLCAGIASLIYEVVWVRQLGLSLGSTAVATSVMLSAFLGGLAIGSWAIGKYADSTPSAFRLLARTEIAAAVFGLLSIPMLARAGHAYVFITTNFGLQGGGALALRAAFAAIVMLVPAILFGMTFPLSTVEGGRLIGGQKAAGIISAFSAFGSAIGAALCGFFLEPSLGIFHSAMVGMALNLVAAVFAYVGHYLTVSTTDPKD